MATVKDIRPGDIWEENDGDYVQILEETASPWPDDSRRAYLVNAYYQATDMMFWEQFEDSEWPEAYTEGSLRYDNDLKTLIYRQDPYMQSVGYTSISAIGPWSEVGQDEINDLVDNQALASAGVFQTKDSGKREVRPSGYQRDTQDGKPRFDLILPLDIPYEHQMLTRLAQLLSRGAEKYTERNWERADDVESLERFKASALRHLLQWISGELDEDHAAAVMYNIIAHESTNWKMNHGKEAL